MTDQPHITDIFIIGGGINGCGIARDAVTLRDEDGNEYVLDKHLVADKILDMTRAALAKYHQDLMQNVRDRANRKLNAIRAIRSG